MHTDPAHPDPVDPDVSLDVPAQRRELGPAVLCAVALGGGLGALARLGVSEVVPTPWALLVVNVSGSALIGVLMVLVPRLHPLARPFLGVGVLGGYTTFSGYALDVVRLGWSGLAYLAGTAVLALGATLTAVAATRRVLIRVAKGAAR